VRQVSSSDGSRWKICRGSHDEIEKFEGPMIAISARLAARRLHYAWVIIALTFVVIVVTAGVRATPGVLIVPFENEFHWSRATISFAIGINLLVYGVVGPFAAAAMDRFGVRRTMAVSLAVAAAGVALSPLMYNPWQLVLLWGLVVGLSTGFVGAYLAAYIAARWFHARQGMVVGLLTAANAAGQLIFLPTNAALIAYAGWRAMVLILAGIVLLVVLPLLLLMRDHPQDLGLFAYGDTTGLGLAPPHSGNPVAVAFRALWDGARVRDFWLISGGYFVCGASTMGLIGTHLIPACVDHGLTEVTAAGLLAATGVFAVIGGTASGWLSDRFETDICCFGIMDCAVYRCCTCPSPSTRRSTACRCLAFFTVSTGSPPQRRQCGSSVMRSAWNGSASWWLGSP
jgi:MFS family permease